MGDQPDIATSTETLLNESDAPAAIVGGVAQPPLIGSIAAPSRSLFQTACVALRLIQDATWSMTRAGRIAFITTVSW